MHIARVIGNVVATKKTTTLKGMKLLVLKNIDKEGNETGEPLVAVDTAMAGVGDTVFYIIGREASMALPEKFSPVDATIVGIVDYAPLY